MVWLNLAASRKGAYERLGATSLATRMRILVLIPILALVGTIIPLANFGLNNLQHDLNVSRLRDEVRIIASQFALIEDDLVAASSILASDSRLIDAVQRDDFIDTRSILTSITVAADLSHVQFVSVDGEAVHPVHQSEFAISGPLEELHQLGLLEITTSRLIPTDAAWMLIVVRPVKSKDRVEGTVTVGRLLDSKTLAKINFGRDEPRLILFDSQRNSISSSDTRDALPAPVVANSDLWNRALGSEVVLDDLTIDHDRFLIAYAPFVVENRTVAVFGLALSTETSGLFIDRLIWLTVAIAGAVALLAGLIGYWVAKRFTAPIVKLRNAALAIGNGNYAEISGIKSGGEVGDLAQAFNLMTANLTESKRLLEEGKQALEARVQERTENLQMANQQLVDAQDQLVISTKLAAIGQLSGGVAHDLRNPLGAIKNAAYLLNKKLTSEGAIDSNPKLGQYIGIINQQIDRSNRIITDLMAFARVGSPTLTEIHLDQVLEESLETMVKNDNVTLTKQVHPDLCPVMGDSEQLQRVFSNLANNAQEAMPDGGQLTISAKGVNNHVEITFSDTGEGISEENIGKIFDPLFTTKTKGTGLGLAVCHEIILRHGGTISARRNEEPSGGTTFEIILPAADARLHTEGEPTHDQ